MTMEMIFSVVTAVITGVLGAITKNRVVPARFVPLQNIIIGLIAGGIAVYFKIFNDIPTAIITCLAFTLCAGGTYDAVTILKKENDVEKGED